MASKWFSLVVVVLHLVKESVCLCPFPETPNHGFGHIIGSKENGTVRPLEEKEIFQIVCQPGFALLYDSEPLFTCSDGTLQGNSIHPPMCEKNLNLSTWKILHDNVTIPEEAWCKSGQGEELLQIGLIPKIKNVKVEELREVVIRTCGSTSFDWHCSERVLQVRVNDFFNCTLELRNVYIHVFRCENAYFTETMVDKISITANGPVMIRGIVVLTRLRDYCGTPSIPVGGNITEISAREFQYSCSPGLQLSGNAIAKCDRSTGRWTGAPTCVVVNHGLPFYWMWVLIAISVAFLMVTGITIFKYNRRRNVPEETGTRNRNPTYPSYRDEVEAWKVAFIIGQMMKFYLISPD